jgi:hypothetical protein
MRVLLAHAVATMIMASASACSQPTADTTSLDEFTRSMSKMKAHLSDDRSADLDLAVRAVMFSQIGPALRVGMAEARRDSPSPTDLNVSPERYQALQRRVLGVMLRPMQGLTAAEIIAKGDSIRAANGGIPIPNLPAILEGAGNGGAPGQPIRERRSGRKRHRPGS